MNGELKSRNGLIFSYLVLRKAIGVLGTAMPFLLFFGALIIFGTGIQSSVSSYYYTGMGDVFVGILFAMGFFLFSYRGYEEIDNRYGNLAFVFALGVALFPTPPDGPPEATDLQIGVGYVHFVFVGLFFLTLVYFSLCLFTRTDSKKTPNSMKLKRDKVYRFCGYAMLVCLGLIVVYYALPRLSLDELASAIEPYSPVFWLEALAIVFFGISWLVKGEALMRDHA